MMESKKKGETVVIRCAVKKEIWEKFISLTTHDRNLVEWVGEAIREFVERRESEEKEKKGLPDIKTSLPPNRSLPDVHGLNPYTGCGGE